MVRPDGWSIAATLGAGPGVDLRRGLSNWLDRLRLGGYVVDFINLGIGPVRTGIFNFADVALTSGALLMLHASWRERSGPRIGS